MKILGAVAVALCMCAPAMAEVKDGAEIAKVAQKCWLLNDRDVTESFAASVEARIGPDGNGEFRIASYKPKTPAGRTMSEAAKRTLLKCSPYEGIAPGLYRFEMTYEDPFDQ
ncbi:MAG: hypothetical protein ACTHOP_25180 [Mesorhizobium sp.]